MKTKSLAILLIIIASILTSLAQVAYKFAADWIVYTNIISFLTNYPFIIGLFLYGTAGVFLVKSFKRGDVTVLYPLFASSYILVILFSHYIFGEVITSYKWIGVAVIIFGITLVSIGSKKKSSAMAYDAGAV